MMKARKGVVAHRRGKRGAEYYAYDTWNGRVSVHMKVKYFDLKLLVKNVLQETDLFVENNGWEMKEFCDAIRLSLPSSSTRAATSTYTGGLGGKERGTTDTNTKAAPQVDLLDDKPLIPVEAQPLLPPTAYQHDQYAQEPATILEAATTTSEIYIFSFGAIVFWNFHDKESEEAWMKKYIFGVNLRLNNQVEDYDDDDDDAIGEAIHEDAIENAYDDMKFTYGPNYQIKHGIVVLLTHEYGEKLALSFALAKSAMLSIFEWRLDQAIERNSDIPERLVKYGRLGRTRKEISKEIGRIFLVKSGINLEHSILDTPDEFWEGKCQ